MAGGFEQIYADSDGLALADLVRRKEVTALEIVDTAIGLVERIDPKLNTVVIRHFEVAREAAANPGSGPFAGVPYLLKNIGSAWKGTKLTAGLPHLKDFVCTTDSELSKRTRDAGFAVLGRANTPEWGWCITTEPKLYGPTVNPWNPAFTAGGSSGGSAAAVAARLVPMAEATDGGGSIRVPASCNGLVGLKPSRGRITFGPDDADIFHGSVYSSCVSRTVRDTAAYLDAVAGPLTGDYYQAPKPAEGWLAQLEQSPKRLRLAYTVAAPWGDPISPEVRAVVEATAKLLESMGHTVEEYDIKTDLEAAWWTYNDLVAVEHAADIARTAKMLGKPIDETALSAFNQSMLKHARTLSAEQYSEVLTTVKKNTRKIAQELSTFDAYLTPTLTQPPRPVGYWSMEDGDFKRYLNRWSDAAYMFPFNFSGLPGISLPGGMSSANTPIGVQLVGRLADEATLLRLARQLEIAAPWIQRRAQISA